MGERGRQVREERQREEERQSHKRGDGVGETTEEGRTGETEGARRQGGGLGEIEDNPKRSKEDRGSMPYRGSTQKT